MRDSIKSAIREAIEIPENISAIAGAARYDVLFGPVYCEAIEPAAFTGDSYASLPQDLEAPVEFYSSSAANALREFIAELPGSLYVDLDSGFASTEAPEESLQCYDCEEGEGQEDCETCSGAGWIECDNSEIYRIDSRDIVAALFGETIAREFN